jgi:non-ribosomal peptide synthetase component F
MYFSPDNGIHPLIESQTQLRPDAVAVVYGARQLTYRELNTRANRLAHFLHALGARPEMRAAICMQRSPELIVALLAILKAGCARDRIEDAPC